MDWEKVFERVKDKKAKFNWLLYAPLPLALLLLLMTTLSMAIGGRGLWIITAFTVMLALLIVVVILFCIAKDLTTHIKEVRNGKRKPWNAGAKMLMFSWFLVFVVIGINCVKEMNSFFTALGVFLFLQLVGYGSFRLYFLPYFTANAKKHSQESAIFIVNLLAAWTMLGWIVALVWAYTKEKETSKSTVYSKSIEEQIEKAWNLHRQGVITREEFEQRKSKLLQQ